MSAMTEVWWPYVAHATWQSTMVGIALLGLVWALRRSPASIRYGLLVIALLKFAVPPMMSFPTGVFSRPEVASVAAPGKPHITESWMAPELAAAPGGIEAAPTFGAAQPRQVATSSAAEAPVREQVGATWIPAVARSDVAADTRPAQAGTGGSNIDSLPARPSSRPRAAWMTWRALFLDIHLAGCVVVAVWIGHACWAIRRLTKRCQVVSDGPLHALLTALSERLGLRRRIRLLLAPAGTPPMAFGVVRATVVLPENLTQQLPGDKLTALLAHELAHHRR